MSELLRRVRAAFNLEFEISFPFPAAETLFIVLFLLTTLSIMTEYSFLNFHVIPLPPGYVHPEVSYIAWALAHADFQLLTGPLFNMTLLIIVLIPLLSAFRVAGPFETGLLKTVLTYPVRRRDLLIFKASEIFLLTALPITVGVTISIGLFEWLGINLDSLTLLLSFWTMAFTVLSSSLFLSIATRSTAKTALGAIAMWMTLYLVAALTYIPNVLRGVLNPVGIVISFFYETPGASPFGVPFKDVTILDVWGAIITNVLIGFFIFFLSIRLFRRVEV